MSPKTVEFTVNHSGEANGERLFFHADSEELRTFYSDEQLRKFLDENGEDYFDDFEKIEERSYTITAACGQTSTQFELQGLHFWLFWKDAPDNLILEAGGMDDLDVYLNGYPDSSFEWEDADFTEATGLNYDSMKEVLLDAINQHQLSIPFNSNTVD